MQFKIIHLILTIVLFSCSSQQVEEKLTENHLPVSIDTQRLIHKTNWNGTYSGVIPCASCTGIKMNLTILEDHTYKLTQEYLDEDQSSKTHLLSGRFSWVTYPYKIQLDNQDQFKFKIDPGIAVFLDTDGNIIEGGLANKYILLKSDS